MLTKACADVLVPDEISLSLGAVWAGYAEGCEGGEEDGVSKGRLFRRARGSMVIICYVVS